VFANYLIGLREGLEAALVVGILVAYVVRTGNRGRLVPIWIGVGVAVAASIGVGAVLTYTSRSLSFEAQEAFGGIMSIIAVAFVTWMVFWMRRQARFLKGELHGKVDAAIAGGTVALTVMAFVAVGREGLETALFLWAAQSAGDGASPLIGAVLGLITATVVGWLIYKGSVRIDLAKFFRITGAGLIIVAGGVLAYGMHDLWEAGIIDVLSSKAFDVTETIPPSSWYGTLLRGIFNFRPDMSWLEVVVWAMYVVPVMILFFRPVRVPAPPSPSVPPPVVPREPVVVSR
jgi:high-affinity iron transporter